jgi:IS1 family transposase
MNCLAFLAKKERVYVVISVVRESRLIVGAEVLLSREWEAMQDYADSLPAAERYCADDLSVYSELLWPPTPDGGRSEHVISYGKEETYTIEGVNADVRTYLGRLKRRSRCFSRSLEALRRAVRLFVWHYNRRQRVLNRNPKLRSHLCLLF